MLRVKDVCKEYRTGGYVQRALDHVSLDLRDHEFVAILGPSGSGKTTLLNVIGGLDRYDAGDLIVQGVSTRSYSDRDWDAYRNHSVGFIFQGYHLIPHQTVLANVELALTIAGLTGPERTRRAARALERVGLGEQMHKLPGQMSGGQMQRVAIARALVNEPDILLADEPTGALDSKTSVQVMELLKELSREKLVVMVTHNPELAHEYATRIIRLRDGRIRADSDPYTAAPAAGCKARPRHTGMNLWTAAGLSFHNLWSKRRRTLLVSFAGSIGIIGIALIAALSNGMNRYIDSVEQETLSEYPITLGSTGVDASTLESFLNREDAQESDRVTERKLLSDLFSKINTNDLRAFKAYLDSGESGIDEYARAVEYRYGVAPLIYAEQNGHWRQVNPDTTLSSLGLLSSAGVSSLVNAVGGMDVFHALPEDASLYLERYEIKAGRWPEAYDECVLVLTADGRVSDMALYAMGLHDSAELDGLVSAFLTGGAVGGGREPGVYDYEDFLGIEFRLVHASQLYSYDRRGGVWTDKSGDAAYVARLAEEGQPLTIVGVARPADGAASNILDAGIGYSPALVRYVIDYAADSEIVRAQLAAPDTDVFTGRRFGEEQSAGAFGAFDVSALFDVDEDALIRAFGINESAITLPALDIGDVALPDVEEFGGMELSLPSFDSGSLARLCEAALRDVTREEASALFHDLLAGYLAYADLEEIVDLDVLRQRLQTYIRALDPGAFSVDEAALREMFDEDELNRRISAYLESVDSGGPSGEPTSADALTAIIADYIAESLQNAGLLTGPAGAYLEQISEEELLAIFSDFFAEALGELDDFSASFAAYLHTDEARAMIENAVAGLVDTDVLEAELGRIAGEYSGAIEAQVAGAVEQLVLSVADSIAGSVEGSLTALLDELTGADLAALITVDTDAFAGALRLDMEPEELLALAAQLLSSEEATLGGNLAKLGYAAEDDPDTITIYPADFAGKYAILDIIDGYNASRLAAGAAEEVITYADVVGTMTRSVTNIINAVSYVLIAFVAISLIVSSIMIGVITYISVLERRKEIGILRAMGASKRNITALFHAETFLTGALSGVFGVALSLLLLIPGNLLLRRAVHQVEIVARLPLGAALLLIALSIALTLLGGLIPARKAARCDPVAALRSE